MPAAESLRQGIKARGDLLFIGGLVGWDEHGRFPADFVGQTRRLLRNIVVVLAEGGVAPRHIVRMTWYVRDMDEYLDARPALAEVHREVMGDHYPAMALVAVTRAGRAAGAARNRDSAVVPEG